MFTLYHLWLSPFSRKVRVFLNEKSIEFDMVVEKVWERRKEFIQLNPACKVPVLLDHDGNALCESSAICEYLEELYPEPNLIGKTPAERAEIRRLTTWFDDKFHHEVTKHLVGEKIMKKFLGLGHPNSKAVRAGQVNIHYHLDYIGWLFERRGWLGGNRITLADITAAAHLSCIDYLGDVPWEDHILAKEWYAKIKSRPSFRPVLSDYIPGRAPPNYYADLDF